MFKQDLSKVGGTVDNRLLELMERAGTYRMERGYSLFLLLPL